MSAYKIDSVRNLNLRESPGDAIEHDMYSKHVFSPPLGSKSWVQNLFDIFKRFLL